MCSVKNVFLKISQILQENTCLSLFLKKLQVFKPACLLKRDSNTGVSCEHCKTFKDTYFEVHLRTTSSVFLKS